MWPIYLIAKNTFKEIAHEKIFYALIGFSVFILGLSLALGQLTFAEQSRISINFGFTAIHLSTVVLSILFASQLIHKEIDRKTIMSLLARPITVDTFLVGKSLGLLSLTMVLLFFLGGIISLIAMGFGMSLNYLLLIGLWGVLLESLVLISMCIFLSAISRPALVVSYAFLLFLMGHSLSSLEYFAARSDEEWFKAASQVIQSITPDLEQFNWRSNFLYHQEISFELVAQNSLVALAWAVLFLIFASFLFRKRDLV